MKIILLLVMLAMTTPIYAQVAPYATAPACLTHDSRAYHGLWDSVRGCHYDHHHGGNPHDLDDVFGTELFTLLDGDGPGHPWQTFSAAGIENDLKHAGYQWHTFRNVGNGSTIPTFRLQMHQHSVLDAGVQFHSYVLEMLIVDPLDGSQGFIRAMGWLNTGDLVMDGVTALNVPDNEPGRHKQHSATGLNQIWYGATMATTNGTVRPNGRVDYPRWITISTSVHNAHGSTQNASPFLSNQFYCESIGIVDDTRCRANSTTYRPHLIGFNGTGGNRQLHAQVAPILDPDGDGWIDGTFYHNRYGVPQPNGACNGASLDCAPYTYQHVRLSGGPSCNDREQCGQLFRNYDVTFGNRSSGWNQPVN
jgi:hypothetical protein